MQSIGQLKAGCRRVHAEPEWFQQLPGDCAAIIDGGALETNGYLPSDWAGPATPKFAAVPTAAAVGANGVAFTLVGTNQAGQLHRDTYGHCHR